MYQTFPEGVLIYDRAVIVTKDGQEWTIRLDGENAQIIVGRQGYSSQFKLQDRNRKDAINFDGDTGDIIIRDDQGRITSHLQGRYANLSLGGSGVDGDIFCYDANGQPALSFHSNLCTLNLHVGNKNGGILIYGPSGLPTITLAGQRGDIVLENADCAEDFDRSESEELEPGTVVVLNEEGKVTMSMESYDKRVAGVVSGAGNNKPGIVLDRKPSQAQRISVALMGKVYCKADAQYAPIEVGDLLTTSPTLGHAMKADDPVRAFGAVIGKAMRPVKRGKNMIPILVALQ